MAATTTTVGAVIDYLLALIPTLPACTGAEVCDGAIGTRHGNLIVLVGNLTEPVTDGTQEWAATGLTRDEDYAVSVMVSAAVGGEAQKPARDACLAVFSAIDAAITADPTLGGLINKNAVVDRLTLQQTDAETATSGRQAVALFSVRVRNRLRKAP